jgi:hypothetical protein
VAYDGTVKALSDAGSLYGWVPTTDGALVVSEPDGASTWLPCNDTASDAAIFDASRGRCIVKVKHTGHNALIQEDNEGLLSYPLIFFICSRSCLVCI